MKRIAIAAISIVFLYSCGSNNKTPDVSGVEIPMVVLRFDKEFFSMDTSQLEQGLNQLQAKYPDFLPLYLVNILGVNPADTQAPMAIKSFIRSYQPVYRAASDMAEKQLPAFEKQLQQSLKYMQHYVPGWKADSPFVVTTFVGPMDAFEPFSLGDYGDVRTSNGVGVALQLHLGAAEAVYEDGRQAGLFFDYQTRRFTPDMMLVNSVKNIVSDAFPYNDASNTLIEAMIEKGKRLYLLEKLLPKTADSLQLGYTGEQLKGCYANEALIWNFFVKNDLLYSKDRSINQAYINDGPKTQELGEGAPGYIGLFTGRQIVRAYMKKHAGTTLPELLKKPATAILEEAGYKP